MPVVTTINLDTTDTTDATDTVMESIVVADQNEN